MQLKNLDYDSELDAVEVLDSLMGLSLSAQNIEERILRTCKYKFKEPDVHCVRLFFGASHNAIDLIVEKDTTVQVLKEALGQVRAKGLKHPAGRYASILVSSRRIPDSIFDLKSDAASGSVIWTVTSDGFTVTVPDAF